MSMWTLFAWIGLITYMGIWACLAYMIHRLLHNPGLARKPGYIALSQYFEDGETIRLFVEKGIKEALVWFGCIGLLFILGWYRFLDV